jgi:hypothetical protein
MTRFARFSGLAALLILAQVACKKEEERAPPPPPAAGPPAGGASLCAGGGGQDNDSVSAAMVPRLVDGFCLDPQSEPKTYGDKGKFSMDDVCTTAFDGECEVYKRFGLDRVVVLRYVDGSGAPNSVEVNLSRFKTEDGAYGMFTKRVVADGDPATASVKGLAAGAAGALSSSNAYVWRGSYVVELTFVSEDPKMTPEGMARENERSTGAIAKAIGNALPAAPDLPPSARLLPPSERLPLGIAYYPKDAPGLAGIGPVAVGYFKDGDKRWRDLAIVSPNIDAAKEAFRVFRLKPGSTPVKGFGEEAVRVMIQEGADRPKAEYIAARKGPAILAIGDEELVLASAPTDQWIPLRLTKDEKVQKLAAWLASVP